MLTTAVTETSSEVLVHMLNTLLIRTNVEILLLFSSPLHHSLLDLQKSFDVQFNPTAQFSSDRTQSPSRCHSQSETCIK